MRPRAILAGWKVAVAGLALALVFGIVEAVQVYVRWRFIEFPGPFWRVLTAVVPPWVALAALAPAVWHLAKRFRFDRPGGRHNVIVHGCASVLFALVHLAINAVNAATLGGMEEGALAALRHLLGLYFVARLLTYWAIVAGFYALAYYQESKDQQVTASRLEARLQEARLDILRAQLKPHFLFNTLNGISTLALKGNRERVVDALSRLSEMLRYTLADAGHTEVPLAQELAFTDHYLALQHLRFGDRLRVRREIAADVLHALVPSMILQPLVENALLHGIGSKVETGTVVVRAARTRDALTLEVKDTGPGFGGEATRVGRLEGVGLRNTRERLHQLYGSAARLDLEGPPEGGALVRLTLPFRQ